MIPLYKAFMPDDLNIGELARVLHSGQLSYGAYGRQFEERLAAYVGNPYILSTSNNNFASLIAFAVLDVKAGDEVIASPMACLASNQPILNFQAKVVWTDIDPQTGTLNPEAVRRNITARTKAILHYHWGGYPGYVDEINEIGRQHGIPVIDDAIESFGSEYKGRKMGNLGTEITCFSFQAVRLPNCVDGGAIAFSSRELYDKAKLIRDFGIHRPGFRDEIGEISSSSDIALAGYNAKMSEINSYIGIHQMAHLPALFRQQRENARGWDTYFNEKEGQSLKRRKEVLPNYWIYSALVQNSKNELINFRNSGYYASRVHLRNDCYSAFGKASSPCPGVDDFEKRQVSVPSGWWLKI
jgi:dTDP-4-amino-4,6-dideoxygalactose transaminase